MSFLFAALRSNHRLFSCSLFCLSFSAFFLLLGGSVEKLAAAEPLVKSDSKPTTGDAEKSTNPPESAAPEQSDKIASLIEQLGSDRYQLRERAQRELETL